MNHPYTPDVGERERTPPPPERMVENEVNDGRWTGGELRLETRVAQGRGRGSACH